MILSAGDLFKTQLFYISLSQNFYKKFIWKTYTSHSMKYEKRKQKRIQIKWDERNIRLNKSEQAQILDRQNI